MAPPISALDLFSASVTPLLMLHRLHLLPCVPKLCSLLLAFPGCGNAIAVEPEPVPELISVADPQKAVAAFQGQTKELTVGDRLGNWTLMAVLRSDREHQTAVFEDFTQTKGQLVFAGVKGNTLKLPKSREPTFADPAGLYNGHKLEEVFGSEHDLLAEQILAKPGDPEYDAVAACFPPISKMHVYTFLGTHDCFEKVGVFYGGSTPNFDPAAYVPAIARIRDEHRVWDGLVGGWLPAIRFVYPESSGNWSELVAFAPMRVENNNNRVQPVWYRLTRIENNVVQWVRYFDSYHPFPPRSEQAAARFYEDLLSMRAGWERALAGGMKIEIPDQRLADLARHSLVRDMITRIGAFPKYGVFDRGYGGSEHDGFPDTFNADTTAMLEWGLFELAGQYLDNYFACFVRDDGSILYRGPETGQFGRMLTVVAEYFNNTSDYTLLLKHRHRIDAVARLLLDLRTTALRLPSTDPAYGMIAGWSEADACLDPEPARYMQPYFSNSTEAERGFHDLGRVWEKIGLARHRAELAVWGQRLQEEARLIGIDVQRAIARSILTNTQPQCLPSIAGAKDPFHIAVERDKLDPQFRSYRAYMEMLYSGNLNRDQVQMIINYRAAHHDTILGIPTCYGYNTHELAGFLSYGHAYGLLQTDLIREYLLSLYSLMAHQYTRGTWTAPETRPLDPKQFAAPYCTPAQMVVPLLTRWMLVFEDPASNVLWLAKATPRSWLEDGQTIAVSNAPTRWGTAAFKLESHLRERRIECKVTLPSRSAPDAIKLRLRVPLTNIIRSVTLNGKNWTQFEPKDETVSLPLSAKSPITLTVQY